MRISRHNKWLLFEQEFLALLLIIIFGAIFYKYNLSIIVYLITLLIGFVLYFWMLYEENIHKTGKKHAYFEHTSSYIILGQAALSLGILSLYLAIPFLAVIFLVIGIIMYSVSLSKIILYKVVFRK